MPYDFDTPVNRCDTASLKWDSCERIFKERDLLPLWVADMDFRAAPAVLQALDRQVQHGVFGYAQDPVPAERFTPVTEWTASRHNARMREDRLRFAPGVVSCLFAAVEAFTRPNDAVIIQPPVYPPFFAAVRKKGRTLVENPLNMVDGRYEMDFDHLKACITPSTRLFLLCNPHNPGGRVWDRATLETLAAICERAGILVISDEIHADITFTPHRFTPFRSVNPRSLTLYAASKAFNIPGLATSLVYSEHKDLLAPLMEALLATGWHQATGFGMAGTLAAFAHGGDWLDELLPYLLANAEYLHEALARRGISMPVPEGSYLGWMDCRTLDVGDLPRFFVEKARIALNSGADYGAQGAGFMRINMGCARSVLREAVARIEGALPCKSPW